VPAKRQEERNQQREAVKIRWAREKAVETEWQKMSIEDAKRVLAELRADAELGARILQQRLGREKPEMKCIICGSRIDGYPVSQAPVRDAATGIYENVFYCSVECVARKNQQQTGVLTLAR
jgi:hypothetical protein